MAASRASSLRALRQVATQSNQVRRLHMTGPATFSSVLTSERPAVGLPRDIAGLRQECQKRQLPTSGTKSELIDRLSAHDLANTRSFSTAVQDTKRPTIEAAAAAAPIRHFNTSRSLKAVNDSSTIDFAYLPDFDPDTGDAPVRVPLLPQNLYHTTSSYAAKEVEEEVMRPEIVTASADSTHISAPSAMSEVHDNNNIDFQGMAARISEAAAKFGQAPVEEQGNALKEMWGGFLDDVFGPKGSGAKPT